MKLQKIILCVAVALTAFGVSLGLLEIGKYLLTAYSPETVEETAVLPILEKQQPVLAENQPDDITVYPFRNMLSPQATAAADPKIESEPEPETYKGGEYYIIGKLPKGFKDFDNLSVETIDYAIVQPGNNYEEFYIPPKGSLYMKKEFKFIRVSVSNERISFETKTIKGISYQFVGKFVDERIDMDEYWEHAELEGQLTKLSGGKKIAGSKVKFAVGGC